MQKVLHEFKHVHPIFDEMERMYVYTSNIEKPKRLVKPLFPKEFRELFGLFNEYGVYKFDIVYKDYKFPKLDFHEDFKKDIVIAFSGGKDSTATALWYKEHNYNVYLYHAQGLNTSYPNEHLIAQDIADYLDVPLIIEKYTLEGKKDFIEHPLKNIIIVNGAISWAVRNGVNPDIAVGNYTNEISASLENTPFYISGDDCIEMWRAYEHSMQDIIPGFKMHLCLESVESTYNILTKNMKLFEMAQSCLGPHRFRQWTQDKNESKYNIKLLKNRCGSCWKCAFEYIWLADHDLTEYNQEYYKHCLDVLVKTEKKEYGLNFVDWKTLWDDWFTHESKYFNEV